MPVSEGELPEFVGMVASGEGDLSQRVGEPVGERERRGFVSWAELRQTMMGEILGEQARRAMEAARVLRGIHVRVRGRHPMILALRESEWCAGCGAAWPCQTTQVLDGTYVGEPTEGEAAAAGRGHPSGCECNAPYPCGREGEEEDKRDKMDNLK